MKPEQNLRAKTLSFTAKLPALVLLVFSTLPAWGAGAPFACTRPAAQITATTATLDGMAVPNGSASQAWFEWGNRGNYGQTTSPVIVGGGTAVVRVSTGISGLTNRGFYQYRLVVSNAEGVVRGAAQLFTTGWKVTAWGRNTYGQTNVPSGLSNVVAVAAGGEHSLALKADGRVVAWGDNYYGQTNVPLGLSNAVAVVGGGEHSLVLKSNGTVVTWGRYDLGQTNVPAGLSNVVAVAAGGYHSLALKADGTVVAWGWYYYGQTNVPSGLSNVVAVAAGGYHSLALKADGIVVAWGWYYYGQTNVPAGLSNVVAVAAGGEHSLALKSNGTVVAWGRYDLGQTNVPSGLSNVVAVAAGGEYSLALQADGTVLAWGGNDFSQTNVPSGLSNVVAVAGGGYHSLAIANLPPRALPLTVSGPPNRDLTIRLDGTDPNGNALSFQIGSLPAVGTLYQYAGGLRGPAITSPDAVVSDAGGRVIFAPVTNEFASPYASFNFVASDGELKSSPATVTVHIIGRPPQAFTQPATQITTTGATLNGVAVPNWFQSMAWFEWGDRGEYSQTTSPVAVGDGTALVHVSAGINDLNSGDVYQCRLVVSNAEWVVYGAAQLFTTGRKVAAWGYNSDGQTDVPSSLSNVVAVAAGGRHSLVVKADGTAAAWGWNNSGQTDVPWDLNDVAAVAGGGEHSLALQDNGTVVAWGDNYYGQTNVPSTLSNVVAVAAGDYYCLALQADGRVAAWGYNIDGQINVPATLSNVVAVAAGGGHCLALIAGGTVAAWGRTNFGQTAVPAGLSNVVAVAAGSGHSLALVADGTVAAWGDNNYGQTNVPAGLSNVVAVAAGGYHNLALVSDGTVMAWGYNSDGQTNVPVGMSNVVAVAGGGGHCLSIGNVPPQALPQTVSGPINRDLVIALDGIDRNGDALSFRISALPVVGTLYQYNSGLHGPAITTPDTVVNDAGGRVIFAPVTNELASPYDSFNFLASDGEADSAPATVTVNILLPPAPEFTGYSVTYDGNFQLQFNGGANAVYRVWASTNLADWAVVGTAEETTEGVFLFLDTSANNWPQRFYRAGAP